MDGVKINLNGLDEDLTRLINKYPDETEAFLRKSATAFKKDVNKRGYSNIHHDMTKNWKNEWTRTSIGQGVGIQVYNNHPLFHLIENGHTAVNGRFVSGKKWAEKTRAEWQMSFPKDVETFADQMLRGVNL